MKMKFSKFDADQSKTYRKKLALKLKEEMSSKQHLENLYE